MISRRLDAFLSNRRCTLLGVGPMSKNCVDASIELANTFEVPLILIASRRQIDAEEFGGGYVNNWSTERFSDYVIDQDRKGKVILARDHGGPWQNDTERDDMLSLRRAMESAKQSFKADIESGFEIIHIDTCVDIHGTPSADEVLERAFELYEFCWSIAQRCDREVMFEVGTEEQTGTTNTQEELEYTLSSLFNFCKKNKLPSPSFVVVQTGTRVMEMRNVGSFDSPVRVVGELPAEIQVPKMIDICNKFNIKMKAHNTDYSSSEALAWHPRLGIHSANVAPEFGVAESRAFIELLSQNKMDSLVDDFINLSFESKKWKKWMLPNGNATDNDRAVIAGHYVFSSPEFVEIKKTAKHDLELKGIDLDEYLKDSLKTSIMRYLTNFRLI